MRLFPLVFLRIRGGKKTKGEWSHMQQIKQTGGQADRQANASFSFSFSPLVLPLFMKQVCSIMTVVSSGNTGRGGREGARARRRGGGIRGRKGDM